MRISPLESRSSFCYSCLSPCRFLVSIPSRIYSFFRELFLSIGAIFSQSNKKKKILADPPIRRSPTPVVSLVVDTPPTHISPTDPHSSPMSQPQVQNSSERVQRASVGEMPTEMEVELDEVVGQIALVAADHSLPPLPPSPVIAPTVVIPPVVVIRSQKDLMLQAMSDHLHPHMAQIFDSLFTGLDVIRSWKYEADGSYQLKLRQAIKVWVPKEGKEQTKDGALLTFGKVVKGRIDARAKTIYFDEGFSLICDVWLVFFWKEVYPNLIEMKYHHVGKVGIKAGIWPQYETEFKSVDKLVSTWGNIGNRR